VLATLKPLRIDRTRGELPKAIGVLATHRSLRIDRVEGLEPKAASVLATPKPLRIDRTGRSIIERKAALTLATQAPLRIDRIVGVLPKAIGVLATHRSLRIDRIDVPRTAFVVFCGFFRIILPQLQHSRVSGYGTMTFPEGQRRAIRAPAAVGRSLRLRRV